MNNSQLNKFKMCIALQKVCHKNKRAVDSNPLFAESLRELEGCTQQIQDMLEQESRLSVGIASKKNTLEAIIADSAMEINSAIFVFAHDIGNQKLREKAHYDPKDFRTTRDNNLLNRSKVVLKNATKLIHYLNEYGVANADLDDLRSKMNDYEALMASPEMEISEQISQKIDTYLKQAEEILTEKLDLLVHDSKEEFGKFFDSYMEARNSSKLEKKLSGNKIPQNKLG